MGKPLIPIGQRTIWCVSLYKNPTVLTFFRAYKNQSTAKAVATRKGGRVAVYTLTVAPSDEY